MKPTPFGLCARKLRLDLGITLGEMAAELGLSSTHLSCVELGKRTLLAKFADEVIDYFSRKQVAPQKLIALHTAALQSMKTIPASIVIERENKLIEAAYGQGRFQKRHANIEKSEIYKNAGFEELK